MAVFIVGCVVLAGWMTDIALLKSFFPGMVVMKANTALAFSLAGISLWLFNAYLPRADRYARHIGQMGRLIDDLLAFLQLGRHEISRQNVMPIDLVNKAIEELQKEQEGRHIDIAIGDLPACEADPILLKQVFVNLISNALKFTRKREAVRIEIGSQLRNGIVVYFVKDNGVGFDMQYAHKLFGVFQRLHSVDEYEGNGVGLANVQRIVHRHGGSIWAEGEVDKGATFYFTINGGILK